MASYRLTYQNGQIFEVVIEPSATHARLQIDICKANLYRVAKGERASEPLHRSGGRVLEVFAVTAQKALVISSEVLRKITDSPLRTVWEQRVKPKVEIRRARIA
jgi:hypothetical protein